MHVYITWVIFQQFSRRSLKAMAFLVLFTFYIFSQWIQKDRKVRFNVKGKKKILSIALIWKINGDFRICKKNLSCYWTYARKQVFVIIIIIIIIIIINIIINTISVSVKLTVTIGEYEYLHIFWFTCIAMYFAILLISERQEDLGVWLSLLISFSSYNFSKTTSPFSSVNA